MIGFQLNTPTPVNAANRTPRKPTFFSGVPAGARRFTPFRDLAALCRHVHALRGADGLELRPATLSFDGSYPFPVFEVFRLRDGEPEFLGCAFVECMSREAFEAALREAEHGHAQPRDHLVIA